MRQIHTDGNLTLNIQKKEGSENRGFSQEWIGLHIDSCCGYLKTSTSHIHDHKNYLKQQCEAPIPKKEWSIFDLTLH